jgi:hypothetical protein
MLVASTTFEIPLALGSATAMAVAKESLTRILALTALAFGTLLAGAAAHAQTHGTDYPVCPNVYGPATYYECRYTTMAQCQAWASGRSAQHSVNPYLASTDSSPPRYQRHRQVY